MTIEEVFSHLYDKYGEDFNWYMLPLTQADGMFVTELKNEIGEDHFLYDKRIWAVAMTDIQYNLMIDGILGIVLIAEIYVIYASFV